MEGTLPERPLIDLSSLVKGTWAEKGFGLIQKPLESMLGVRFLNRNYSEMHENPVGDNFFEASLNQLKVKYAVSDLDLVKIPKEGPLFAVANHPFGALDGLVFGAVLASVRSDAKLLANFLLAVIPEIRPWLFSVDPFGKDDSASKNVASMKEMLRWLKKGGCVATFPSGTVSHLHVRKGRVLDPAWNRQIGGIIRKTGATALPLYFEGRNSALFQALGVAHPLLRTALLPRELANKIGSIIKVRIGSPVSADKLDEFETDGERVNYLRECTYDLKHRDERVSPDDEPVKSKRFFLKKWLTKKSVPVIEPVSPELLRSEVDALPEEQCLVAQKEYVVKVARADQIPNLLREIGRLREVTFREVGEGTGKALDLDAFDDEYLHLFMWNCEESEVVGAYRLGLTDRILSNSGRDGLYTNTLFRFKPGFFSQIDPAVELGRSFISAKYQRKYQSLSMIWKGIGAFLVKHPRYRVLFGPVSISQEYNPLSKDLMVHFLKKKEYSARYADFVKARNPFIFSRLDGLDNQVLDSSVQNLDNVSAMISEIEHDHKGIPVLLRQYLKLNGKLLSFNVDPQFSQVVDGLILVDLETTDAKLLNRFMGRKGAKAFLEYGAESREIRPAS